MAVGLLVVAMVSFLGANTAAAGPNDVASWCPHGGVRVGHPPTPFTVPPPLPTFVWTLLVMNTKGGTPTVVADPVVGAAYSDPSGAPLSNVILCEESTIVPPPPTVVESTTTTVEAPTTTVEAPTTTVEATTSSVDATTTTAAATTAASAAPVVTPAVPHPRPTPRPGATPDTVTPDTVTPSITIVASEPPVIEEATTTEATPAQTTISQSVATTAIPTTSTDAPPATAAAAGINVATFHPDAAELPGRHRSADGLVFFALIAAFGVGVYFTGRQQR